MNNKAFRVIEDHMRSCMKDAAHDEEHIYRVLYSALHIAKFESGVNYDVLIAACLLHDIGREAEFKNPELCHAKVGGEMAMDYLLEIGWDEKAAGHVKSCIQSHRFRSGNTPESIEAKILFDADKLDVTGALGIARTLIYTGQVNEALYTLNNGSVSDGTNKDEPESFFKEFNHKLKNLYELFYTEEGRKLAASRKEIAFSFYGCLMKEIGDTYKMREVLEALLNR